MAKKAKVKVKGVVLLEAFLALLLMAMASYGLASVNSVQFSQMAAGRESDSAKNYAELEAEYLKSLGFDAVVTNNKDDDDPSRTPRYPDGEQSSVDKASNARDMTKFLGDTLGSEWRSTATLGKTINNINGDSDNKIQNIVVSVYKKSDGDNASPRATVTLPLSSQSSGSGLNDLYFCFTPYERGYFYLPSNLGAHERSNYIYDSSSQASSGFTFDLVAKTKYGYVHLDRLCSGPNVSGRPKTYSCYGHTIVISPMSVDSGNSYYNIDGIYRGNLHDDGSRDKKIYIKANI